MPPLLLVGLEDVEKLLAYTAISILGLYLVGAMRSMVEFSWRLQFYGISVVNQTTQRESSCWCSLAQDPRGEERIKRCAPAMKEKRVGSVRA
jgi:hypothetical protein